MNAHFKPPSLEPDAEYLLAALRCASRRLKLIDEEVRRIVALAHEQVVALLTDNRGRLDSLAQALLEHETLDEDDAYAAAGVPKAAAPPADGYVAAARSST